MFRLSRKRYLWASGEAVGFSRSYKESEHETNNSTSIGARSYHRLCREHWFGTERQHNPKRPSWRRNDTGFERNRNLRNAIRFLHHSRGRSRAFEQVDEHQLEEPKRRELGAGPGYHHRSQQRANSVRGHLGEQSFNRHSDHEWHRNQHDTRHLDTDRHDCRRTTGRASVAACRFERTRPIHRQC